MDLDLDFNKESTTLHCFSSHFKKTVMAFTDFKHIGQVLRLYNIRAQRQADIEIPIQKTPVRLVEDIDFALKYTDCESSEAICESLIYPILSSVWKGFLDTFSLYSHSNWHVDDSLSGIPHYLITSISKYGSPVMGLPMLVVIEAKKDNFEEGWGECCAAMYAAQQAKRDNPLKIYGIVTNGKQWKFATLQAALFTQKITAYSIFDLDKLYSALYFVLADCENQLKAAYLVSPSVIISAMSC
jgi:hypothetical protein